ncbi:MAG: hypothetical protein AAFW89_09300 [Bacteroidota bacterium]
MNLEHMLVAYVTMEVLTNILFLVINRWLGPTTNSWKSVFKGVLERIFIIIGVLMGYPHVITAFGALKIGTRLHDDKNSAISNDYFLVGNFISLLAALIFVGFSLYVFGWEIPK